MKTRYRIGVEGTICKRQVLVLQVYKRTPEGEADMYGSGCPSRDAWVDATVEDLSEAMRLHDDV